MGSKSSTRSETLRKRWKEGRFSKRILKGIPHPWNKDKKGTFKKGHKQPEEVKLKVSKTRIEKGVSKGVKNPFYKDGKSGDPYPSEFRHIKNKILERNNWICQLCEVNMEHKRTKGKKWATVHHIDYNKYNNNHLNLISLCNICNVLVNGEREKWTKYFRGLNNGKSI